VSERDAKIAALAEQEAHAQRASDERIRVLEEDAALLKDKISKNETAKGEGNEALEKQIREKEQRIRELEDNEANVRMAIGTAEGHILELTQQLEQHNQNVHQLEVQLDKAKEEGREKDERMSEALAKVESEKKRKEEEIERLKKEMEREKRRKEEEIEGVKAEGMERLAEQKREIESLKTQNNTLVSKLQNIEQVSRPPLSPPLLSLPLLYLSYFSLVSTYTMSRMHHLCKLL
jgi:chromosome segregation ATPase